MIQYAEEGIRQTLKNVRSSSSTTLLAYAGSSDVSAKMSTAEASGIVTCRITVSSTSESSSTQLDQACSQISSASPALVILHLQVGDVDVGADVLTSGSTSTVEPLERWMQAVHGRTVMCMCSAQTNHETLRNLPLILARMSAIVVSTRQVRFAGSEPGPMTPSTSSSPSISDREGTKHGLCLPQDRCPCC